MQTHEIIERWKAGATLEEIADAAGRSKQVVSRKLIRAGYSPRERMYAERASEGSAASASRLEQLTERAEAREAATRRLADLAAEVGQSPRTLVRTSDPELLARVREAAAPFSADYLCHVVPARG